MNEETRTLLGFAAKSGNLVSGDNTCRAHLKSIKLVILSKDCSNETAGYFKKQFGNRCYQTGDRYELGIAIGKSPRTVIGIKDSQFARSIEKSMIGSMDEK
ncbi:ribosomal L7Ae/L30e/S12e/Gadd45 family protein [Clostridia bacterium]|nr:ribosomal L7Ae/L30e/S12e/Gadd45 family protein [Clostridia bacterium]